MFCFFIAEPAPPRVDLQLGRNKRCVILGMGGPQREPPVGLSESFGWKIIMYWVGLKATFTRTLKQNTRFHIRPK